MNIDMNATVQAVVPVVSAAALAIAGEPVVLAVTVGVAAVCVVACVGGALVLAGVWAGQGFPRVWGSDSMVP